MDVLYYVNLLTVGFAHDSRKCTACVGTLNSVGLG
jgi:hypothetical protein